MLEMWTGLRYFIPHILAMYPHTTFLAASAPGAAANAGPILASDPLHCLLDLPFLGLPKYAKKLATHFITVARQLI